MDFDDCTDDDLIERVEHALHQIHTVLQEKPQICERISFRLSSRKQSIHQTRLAKYQDFKGTDTNTIELLNANKEHWIADPSIFWLEANVQRIAGGSDPEEQVIHECISLGLNDAQSAIRRRLLSIILYSYHQGQDSREVLDIARSILSCQVYSYKITDLVNIIQGLLDAGSRYQLIEQALGKGSLLVLGDQLSRQYWEKTLPKKGKMFDECMTHLRNQKIQKTASQYATLQEALIAYKQNQLRVGLRTSEAQSSSVLGKRRRYEQSRTHVDVEEITLAEGTLDQAPDPRIAEDVNKRRSAQPQEVTAMDLQDIHSSGVAQSDLNNRFESPVLHPRQNTSITDAVTWDLHTQNDGTNLWDGYSFNYPPCNDLWNGNEWDYPLDSLNPQPSSSSWECQDLLQPVQ